MLAAIGVVQAPAGTRTFLVGEGPLRAAIEHQIKTQETLSIVQLLGQVENVAAILHDTHFLMLVSEREGLSNALLEGIAAGVLPIVTMTSGTCDVVPFEDYPLFVKGQGEENIVPAIQRAYSMEAEEWRSWSEKLQRHVQHTFGLAEIAERYKKLYGESQGKSARLQGSQQNTPAVNSNQSGSGAGYSTARDNKCYPPFKASN